MSQITRAVVPGQAVRVGVDLAKRVIQVHAVDAAGRVLTTRALARDKFIAWCAQLPAGCIVAMETSSSSHHWARKLMALGLDARIIAAQLVSPYRVATVGDFKQFGHAAQFGAWIGLTPRQHSSGGKNNLGGITKRGDNYPRSLLIQGAKSAVMSAHKRSDPISVWAAALRRRACSTRAESLV